MKLLLIVMAIGITFLASISASPTIRAESMIHDMYFSGLAQDSIGLNFTSPTIGETLSGNITIKGNATVIADVEAMLN